MNAAAATVDDYLAALPADQKAALEDLRRQIHAAAPGVQECISYGMPGFRLGGVLVWIGAGKGHCALYPHGLVADYAERLSGYQTSKGAIRFQPARPLPDDVVRDIVLRRVREEAERTMARASRKRP
jgi:uncharacterized protein YdhG (YjbR/CyaY superfamily)